MFQNESRKKIKNKKLTFFFFENAINTIFRSNNSNDSFPLRRSNQSWMMNNINRYESILDLEAF